MITVEEYVALAPHTYFKIGGPARFFTRVANGAEITEALGWAHDHGLRFFVLGSGSNLLVADKGFDGLVIKIDLQNISISEERVTAGAGVAMARLASETIKHKLAGFEWAVGVPGGVGGSVRGNAGCYGSEIKDVIEKVMALEVGQGGVVITKTFTNAECLFGYRNSVFKQHTEWIIVSAVLALGAGDSAESQELVRQFSKQRAQTQDIGSQCAGCIFKNPEGRSAGQLIDSLALKGLRIGNAAVSEKHGNFILNLGGATAEEVVMLVSIVKERVRQKYGIMLEEEIQYVGF